MLLLLINAFHQAFQLLKIVKSKLYLFFGINLLSFPFHKGWWSYFKWTPSALHWTPKYTTRHWRREDIIRAAKKHQYRLQCTNRLWDWRTGTRDPIGPKHPSQFLCSCYTITSVRSSLYPWRIWWDRERHFTKEHSLVCTQW